MKKLFLFINIGWLVGWSIPCSAQYTGGNSDGYSSSALTTSACPTLLSTNIYAGGASGSGTVSTLQASSCALVSQSNIFFGGSADGSANSELINSVCPAPINTNIYFGGVSDGGSNSELISSVCPAPINTNIYFGGISDGGSNNQLISAVCPVPINTNIFFGGISDGGSNNVLTSSVCPIPINTNIYFGGNNDGSSYNDFINSVCAPHTSTNIYLGGSADGFSRQIIINTPSPCGLLPIDWLSFTGSCRNMQRVLEWSTATESNSKEFTVQYSQAGAAWLDAGTVPASGYSPVSKNYSFTDPEPRSGTMYYRVKETDADGRLIYSKVISVEDCGWSVADNLVILPNPSAGAFNISYTGDKSQVTSIEVFAVPGERVYYSAGFQSRIDLSSQAQGIYFIHINAGARTMIRKLLVVR